MRRDYSSDPILRDNSPNRSMTPLFTIAEGRRSSNVTGALDLTDGESVDSVARVGQRRATPTYNKMELKMPPTSPLELQKVLSINDNAKTSPSPSESNLSDSDLESSKSFEENNTNKSALSPTKSIKNDESTVSTNTFQKGLTLSKKHIRNIIQRQRGNGASPKNKEFGHYSQYRQSVFRPPVGSLLEPRRGQVNKMSMMNLLSVARKLGLLKKDFAFGHYISKEQFNIIKDRSTGKFDFQDQKRIKQLERLKSKVLFTMEEPKKHALKDRRRRTTFLLNKETLTSMKDSYNNLIHKLKKVITPNNKIRILWDFYILLITFYDLFLLPLHLCFDVSFVSDLLAFDIIVNISFFLDILVNFNTGYYSKGLLIMDRKRIAWHYGKKMVLVRFSCYIPLCIYLASSYGQY